MDIFGISSAKIILILIIAIVLLGPEQVPTMVKTVGKTIRDFRRFVNETTKEFNEVTGDLRKEFNDSVGDIRSEIAATQAELKSQFDFSDVVSPITSALRDPLGTLTAPTPEAVAAGATSAMETNTLGTAAVPYTPPQPMPDFANPAPETQPGVAQESAPEQVVVQTPYAESLAAAASANHNGNGTHNGVTDASSDTVYLNGNGNGNGNGHAAFSAPRATKADPFADLVILAPASAAATPALVSAPSLDAVAAPDPVILGVESAPESGLAPIPVITEQAPLVEAVADAPAPRVIRRNPVGGSVAATKYGRKRAS